MNNKSDNYITVAAYYYPGCHSENLWNEVNDPTAPGEMYKVRDAKPLYEGHWQPRIPLWGYEEDESNPKVMEKKLIQQSNMA